MRDIINKITVNRFCLILLFLSIIISIKSQNTSNNVCTSTRFLDNKRCDSLCVINKELDKIGITKIKKIKQVVEEDLWYNKKKKKERAITCEYDTSGLIKHYLRIDGNKVIHEFNLISFNLHQRSAKYHFATFYGNKPKMPDTIMVKLREESINSTPISEKKTSIISDELSRIRHQYKGVDTVKIKNMAIASQTVVGIGLSRYDYFIRYDSVQNWKTTTYIRMGNDRAEFYDFIVFKHNNYTKTEVIDFYSNDFTDQNLFLGYSLTSRIIQYYLDDGCTVIEYQHFINNEVLYKKPYSIMRIIKNKGYDEFVEITNFNKTVSQSKKKEFYYE